MNHSCIEEGCSEPRQTLRHGGTAPRCRDHNAAARREYAKAYRDRQRQVRKDQPTVYFDSVPTDEDVYRQEYRRSNPERFKGYNRSQRDRYKARSEGEILDDQWRLRPDGVKRCGKCGAPKPLEEFHRARANPDGLTESCRACNGRSAHQRAREWWRAFGVDPSSCVYCGSGANHGDHVIPTAQGGPDTVLNIVPACIHCNSSKRDTDLLAWWKGRGALSPIVSVVTLWAENGGPDLGPRDSEALWASIAKAYGFEREG